MTIETAATQGKKDLKTDGSALKGNTGNMAWCSP